MVADMQLLESALCSILGMWEQQNPQTLSVIENILYREGKKFRRQSQDYNFQSRTGAHKTRKRGRGFDTSLISRRV